MALERNAARRVLSVAVQCCAGATAIRRLQAEERAAIAEIEKALARMEATTKGMKSTKGEEDGVR